MRENLNWAVLGTGVIANEMAQALQKMGKSLYAVGNRTHQKAIDFAEKSKNHIWWKLHSSRTHVRLGA